MLYAIVSHIIFPANERRQKLEIRRVNSVKVESSWKNQTDWCEITLPRNVIDFESQKIKELFRRGDKVEVYIGYNGQLWREFEGYITTVSADVPVVIKCEDEMWKLKQLPVNISLQNTTLPKLMADIAPGYEIDALEIELGTVRFSKSTLAEVLKELKDNFDLYSYFQNGKLVVGKIYSDNGATHSISIENDCSANDLKYVSGADRVIKVKAVSTLSNGNKIEVSVGDEGGEERQLTYYNITTEQALKQLATADYERMKLDGYEGDLTCFGYLQAQHGDKASISSSQYQDRDGLYYIDGLDVDMNDTPKYHRKMRIGQKVTA